jgi:hypothetical protein
MKEEVADEEFRIAKAVARQEAKLAAEEQFKEDKFRREIGEIHNHRIDTVRIKKIFLFYSNAIYYSPFFFFR